MTTHQVSHRMLLAAVQARQDRGGPGMIRHGKRLLVEHGGQAISVALEVLQAGNPLRPDLARPLRLSPGSTRG